MTPTPTGPAESPDVLAPMRVRVRRHRARRKQRGVALIMVLGALTILTVLLTDFQDETSAELGSALSARDAVQAEYAARSGVNLARLLVASEPTIRKGLGILGAMLGGGATPQIPVWEFADQVLGAFNDGAGAERFSALTSVKMDEGKNLGLEGAGFDIQIVDEDSKINLNLASREEFSRGILSAEVLGLINHPQFDPMFSTRDGDGQYSDRQTVCGAVIDWIDPNQEASTCDTGSGNAANVASEDSFYQLLDPPYQRKNAPLDSLEELHLVRGVGDDFWTTFVEPEPDDPSQRTLTVWGQGPVNVNTANAQTLMALICAGTMPPAKICTDPVEAATFIQLVTMLRTVARGVPVFGTPSFFVKTLKHQGPFGALLKEFLEPITFVSDKAAAKAFTAESKLFSFYVTGYANATKRESRVRIHSVVDFRGAPPPPHTLADLAASGALDVLAKAAAADPDVFQKMGAGGAASAGDTEPGPDALQLLLRPSPGGRIVYFRID